MRLFKILATGILTGVIGVSAPVISYAETNINNVLNRTIHAENFMSIAEGYTDVINGHRYTDTSEDGDTRIEYDDLGENEVMLNDSGEVIIGDEKIQQEDITAEQKEILDYFQNLLKNSERGSSYFTPDHADQYGEWFTNMLAMAGGKEQAWLDAMGTDIDKDANAYQLPTVNSTEALYNTYARNLAMTKDEYFNMLKKFAKFSSLGMGNNTWNYGGGGIGNNIPTDIGQKKATSAPSWYKPKENQEDVQKRFEAQKKAMETNFKANEIWKIMTKIVTYDKPWWEYVGDFFIWLGKDIADIYSSMSDTDYVTIYLPNKQKKEKLEADLAKINQEKIKFENEFKNKQAELKKKFEEIKAKEDEMIKQQEQYFSENNQLSKEELEAKVSGMQAEIEARQEEYKELEKQYTKDKYNAYLAGEVEYIAQNSDRLTDAQKEIVSNYAKIKNDLEQAQNELKQTKDAATKEELQKKINSLQKEMESKQTGLNSIYEQYAKGYYEQYKEAHPEYEHTYSPATDPFLQNYIRQKEYSATGEVILEFDMVELIESTYTVASEGIYNFTENEKYYDQGMHGEGGKSWLDRCGARWNDIVANPVREDERYAGMSPTALFSAPDLKNEFDSDRADFRAKYNEWKDAVYAKEEAVRERLKAEQSGNADLAKQWADYEAQLDAEIAKRLDELNDMLGYDNYDIPEEYRDLINSIYALMDDDYRLSALNLENELYSIANLLKKKHAQFVNKDEFDKRMNRLFADKNITMFDYNSFLNDYYKVHGGMGTIGSEYAPMAFNYVKDASGWNDYKQYVDRLLFGDMYGLRDLLGNDSFFGNGYMALTAMKEKTLRQVTENVTYYGHFNDDFLWRIENSAGKEVGVYETNEPKLWITGGSPDTYHLTQNQRADVYLVTARVYRVRYYVFDPITSTVLASWEENDIEVTPQENSASTRWVKVFTATYTTFKSKTKGVKRNSELWDTQQIQ